LRHLKTRLLAGILILFTAANVVAYNHAWRMSHFVSGGIRTQVPEKLSGLSKIGVLVMGVTIPKPVNLRKPSDVGLPYRTLIIPGGSTEQLEAWAIESAATRNWVLLFAGYAGVKSQLLEEAAEFRTMGFNVLLVDLPGSGGSSGSTTSIGYHEGADVAASWRYAVANLHPQKIFLYGRSMGAASVIRAVSAFGAQPSGVILECPFDWLLDTVANRFRIMGIPAFPGAQAIVFWASVQQRTNYFDYSLSREAARVSCPALLMAGQNDTRATVPEARAVFDALKGKKEWLLFEGAGHQQYLTYNREEWRGAVKRLVIN